MKKIKIKDCKGFTLIELLVVVLIIGILSAMALPQYQKTVLRSRTAEVWANLGTLNKAVKAACLENPDGTVFFSEGNYDLLSIEVQDSEYFTYRGVIACSAASGAHDLYATYRGGGNHNFRLGINRNGQRICDGTSCTELGFTKVLSGTTNCIVTGGNGSCYYMD